MQDSGLAETQTESNIVGPNISEQIFNGKAYKKAMRAHKLSLSALWHLVMPDIIAFVEEHNIELLNEIQVVSSTENVEALVTTLKTTYLASIVCGIQEPEERELQVLVAVHGDGVNIAHVHQGPTRRQLEPPPSEFWHDATILYAL